MRYTIPITTRPKAPGATEEIRLFTMTDHQAKLFLGISRALATAGGMSVRDAAHVVEQTVVKMLGGTMPPENAPPEFRDLRMAFPVLRSKDVKKLPIAGCPRGRITAFVLGAGFEGESRTMLVEFDQDQANWYADAMREVMERDGLSRDQAWLWVNNLIGRLLAGAEFKDDCDEMILMRAASLFPMLSQDDIAKLPLATEADVRRWSFREDEL